ncbi:MAG: hypothetical protein NTW72_07985 [Gemmatimonadetes bacterium]|jgi:hypothetical protein|nr:hypothetical protein [Gemmatimonadota bacterium]
MIRGGAVRDVVMLGLNAPGPALAFQAFTRVMLAAKVREVLDA